MAVIKTYSELYKVLEKATENAIDKVTIDIENLINDFLQKWYDDYNPKVYQRTYQFLNSCARINTTNIGGIIKATVLIDTSTDYGDVTGLEVANWANQGIHGNPETYGRRGYTRLEFWNAPMEVIKYYQMVQTNFIEYLKNNGLNVIYKGR